MTLQMLIYFVALARTGSFTEAADACYVSQPALSRAVANLEKDVGCALLERDRRKAVYLTPAGNVMLTEAQRVLGQVDVMTARVRAADQNTRGGLSLGYIAYGLLRAFRASADAALTGMKEEGIRLYPVYASAPEVKERLVSGELDCAVLPHSSALDLVDCRKKTVCRLEMRAMIPREHPLFGADSIRLAQLREAKFVFFDPNDHPVTLAENMALCREAGFAPNIVGYGRKAGDVVDLLHQYGAAGLVTEAFGYVQSEDLRLVPIAGCDARRELMLVMRAANDNPAAQRLWALLEETLLRQN